MTQPISNTAPPDRLPDEKQVVHWLDVNRYRPVSPWLFVGLTALLITSVVMIGVGDASGRSQTLTIFVGLAALGYVIIRARRIRAAEQDSRRVQELTVTRQWRASFDLAWKTLPAVRQMPEQYARTLACLAYNLDQLRRYDSAIFAYKRLLETLSPDHNFAAQVQAHLVIALLSNDQLADADDRLRKLRLQLGKQNPMVQALIQLADLMQMVQTYHYAEALELEPNAKSIFRPLGVDAGFAYALLAWSRHELYRRQVALRLRADASDAAGLEAIDTAAREHLQAASQWWELATLLLPPWVILTRFSAIAELGRLPATPSPVWDATQTTDRGASAKGAA